VAQLSSEPIMRRWLRDFDDAAILAMARGVWNRRGGTLEAVAEHRARLQVPKP
jgi:hypothetical protein